MLGQENNPNVYMPINKNEAGFTMISVLIMFTIIIIMMPFFVYFMQMISPTSYDDELAARQLFIFVRNDAILAEQFYERNNKLYFTVNERETATIEKYQDVIRRQVNRKGHEIYMRNIEQLETESLAHGIRVIVTTITGETYEKTILYYEK